MNDILHKYMFILNSIEKGTVGDYTKKPWLDSKDLARYQLADPESFSVYALRVWEVLVRDGYAEQYGNPEIDALDDVSDVSFRASMK